MLKSRVLIITFFIFASLLWSNSAHAYACLDDPSSCPCANYAEAQITSVSPHSFSYGSTLTINGYGFGDAPGGPDWYPGYILFHNGSAAALIVNWDYGGVSWSNNQITFLPNSTNFLASPPDGGYIELVLRHVGVGTGEKRVCGLNSATSWSFQQMCESFTYTNWSSCSNFQQTRSVVSASPSGCAGGVPILTQSCTPTCTENDWACNSWSACDTNGTQNRSCQKTTNCIGDVPTPATSQNCTYIPPVCTAWTYSDWSTCSSNGVQTRNILSSSPSGCSAGIPILTQSCTYIPPTCNSWTYSSWSDCQTNGTQTRTITNSSPDNCVGGNPVINQNCTYVPSCTANNYSCGDWLACSQSGTQTRVCNKTTNCQDNASSPAITQSCVYTPPCAYFYYSNWSECSQDGKQTRNITSKYPSNCEGGVSSQTTQSCTPPCTSDTWSCGDWNSCSASGAQTRTCNRTFDCPTAYTPSPATAQSCTPSCTADTWTCDSWGACSLSGIQSRSCTKTFDCPNIQSAPPLADQYCEAPSRPQQAPPSASDEISNQDTIIKATVKLLCPVDAQKASQGSGTVIDSAGTILTNKHVVVGTLGCLVGFIDDFDNEPYFGDRQIADILKVSSNQDIAVLKIRNPQNKKLPYVDTTKGSVNFALGTKITTYGYPAKFGTKVTYTSGDFSGTDGGYLKTTAILEYGNSGGGAYLKNGTYIGIPSAVVKGELNALGYILSINTIRAWLNNSGIASSNTNNNYSRVSVLEDIDLKKLGSLKLFIPDVDEKSNLVTPTIKQKSTQNTPKTAEQPQIIQPQKESVVIESGDLNKESAVDKNVSPAPEQQKPKISVTKRFFLWLSNLFNKLATR